MDIFKRKVKNQPVEKPIINMDIRPPEKIENLSEQTVNQTETLDQNSKKSSKKKILLIIFIIFLTLIVIALTGLFGYRWYLQENIKRSIENSNIENAKNLNQTLKKITFGFDKTFEQTLNSKIKKIFEEKNYEGALKYAQNVKEKIGYDAVGYFYDLMTEKGYVFILNGDGRNRKCFDVNFKVLSSYETSYKEVDVSMPQNKAKLDEMRKQSVNACLEEFYIEDKAKEFNIVLSEQQINDEYRKIIDLNGGDAEWAKLLKNIYGVSSDEFKNFITRPAILKQKVSEKFNTLEETTAQALKRAQQIVKEARSGGNFSDLAKKYSDDFETKDKGGDLGYINPGQMIPEFEEVAFKLKLNEISDPVLTVNGYQIIKVTDIKEIKDTSLPPVPPGPENAVNVKKEIKASYILIKIQTFNDWLSGRVSQANIILNKTLIETIK